MGLFSRSRLRGTQGARLYITAQVWVPAGLRGACSGRSKLRNLASNHGIAFRSARPNQAHANPKKVISLVFSRFRSFFHLSLLLFLNYHISSERLGSHDTTAALQAFHFVTDTNGAFACGFVSVRVCECHRQILQRQEPRTNSLENRGAIHLFGSFSCLLCSLPLLCARITP